MGFLRELECSSCRTAFSPNRLQNLCTRCGNPLLARYDLDAIEKAVSREDLASRQGGLWRYKEFLPVEKDENVINLGAGGTPMIAADRLASGAGSDTMLYLKDESMNPTGSFKARGMAVAVSRAVELGAEILSLPSAGNAASAMSAYTAAAGIEAKIFMPLDVPSAFITECRAFGADITLVEGLITDAGELAACELEEGRRFDLSTLREPYRLEGKKTMGYEIAEQMNWNLPDVIIYPTGGGTGLIGIWKAFEELSELGWIGGSLPRMVAVQSDGCAPIVKAFREGRDSAEFWHNARSVAGGIRVPAAAGDFLILRTLRESGGTAVDVPDAGLIDAVERIARAEGVFVSPEAAATLLALQKLESKGWISGGETVLLMITGGGMKYIDIFAAAASDEGRVRRHEDSPDSE